MQDNEHIQGRLDNIRTVEPILDALRTISIGNWQLALRQQGRLRDYVGRVHAILAVLAPCLRPERENHPDAATPQRIDALVIGSERGLCGRFNIAIAEHAVAYRQAQAQQAHTVEFLALGARLVRLLQRRNWSLTWSGPLSVTALPPFDMARQLAERWLAAYQARQIDAVDLIYNTYLRPGVYAPTVTRLLPPTLPPAARRQETWPPPIIETDPQGMAVRLIEQLVLTRLYQVLLESAAAEHSARFQLMEAATQNANRLIEELTLLVQSARKYAITREMQELAAGAGLLGPQS